jgi:HAD superfamily hydrolase (TIGR01549 family)
MPDRNSVRNPVDRTGRIRGVLFDLDGTLYRQPPLRLAMTAELATLPLRRPFSFSTEIKALKSYRRAHEALRSGGFTNVARNQIEMAAQSSRLSTERVEQLVREWMHERPLKYLRFVKARGLTALLRWLASRNIRLGVLSDYPAEAKLRALGHQGAFDPILCSTAPEIDALKPDPKGFLYACNKWNLPPSEILMVGDRSEVDGRGAAAAGMPCVVVGKRTEPANDKFIWIPSLERLRDALDDER